MEWEVPTIYLILTPRSRQQFPRILLRQFGEDSSPEEYFFFAQIMEVMRSVLTWSDLKWSKISVFLMVRLTKGAVLVVKFLWSSDWGSALCPNESLKKVFRTNYGGVSAGPAPFRWQMVWNIDFFNRIRFLISYFLRENGFAKSRGEKWKAKREMFFRPDVWQNMGQGKIVPKRS